MSRTLAGDTAKVEPQVLILSSVIELVVLVWFVSLTSYRYVTVTITYSQWHIMASHIQEYAHLAILDPVDTKLALLQVAMDDVVTLGLSPKLPGQVKLP